MLVVQKSLDEPDTAHSLNSSLLDPLDLHLQPMESIDSLIIFPETAAGYISQVGPAPSSDGAHCTLAFCVQPGSVACFAQLRLAAAAAVSIPRCTK